MTATSSASPPSPPAAAVFRPPPTRRRILHPEPDQMQREEGFILWEWRRRWDFLVDPIISRFANIEKRGKKEEQKPSFVVIHRPKPGKPTDLSTMCQILVKLKHTPTPPASSPAKDVAAADEISVTEGQPVKPEVHMKLDVPQLQWSSGDGNAICGL
ncbi:Clathrin light chain [Musa troglodytarum]|uniref:Clathrin light chain n=1 Tax=Musa troglodytarum TaxID=320322 RepID=A0A9E7F1L7_9LILI|nr:Clathrin light chain [Musa troglodytarum]